MTDSVLLYTLPGIAAIGLAIGSCVCIRFLKRRKQASVPVYPPVQPVQPVYEFQQPYNSTQAYPIYGQQPMIPMYSPVQSTGPMYNPVQPTAPMVSFYGGPTTPTPSAPPIDSAYPTPQTHIILNQVQPHQRIYFS
jgi:hypothetical protein